MRNKRGIISLIKKIECFILIVLTTVTSVDFCNINILSNNVNAYAATAPTGTTHTVSYVNSSNVTISTCNKNDSNSNTGISPNPFTGTYNHKRNAKGYWDGTGATACNEGGCWYTLSVTKNSGSSHISITNYGWGSSSNCSYNTDNSWSQTNCYPHYRTYSDSNTDGLTANLTVTVTKYWNATKNVSCSFTSKCYEDAYLRTPATCTQAATYWYKCSGCNNRSTTSYFTNGSPLVHQYCEYDTKGESEDHMISAATCTTGSKWYKRCRDCGQYASDSSYSFTAQDKLPHKYTSAFDWVWNTDRSEVKATVKCSDCGGTAIYRSVDGDITISENECDGIKTFTGNVKLADSKTATNEACSYRVTGEKGVGIEEVLPEEKYISPGNTGCITATVKNGYTFKEWKSSKESVLSGSTGKTYNYSMPEEGAIPVTLTAVATENMPVFTVQPSDAGLIEGQSVVFEITATNANSYQWQYRAPVSSNVVEGKVQHTYDDGDWSIISGATSPVYTIKNAPPSHDGYQYRCIATNVDKSAASYAATLNVASNNISYITAEYSHKRVSFGETIDADDIYIMTHFINNNVSLTKNMSGVTIKDKGNSFLVTKDEIGSTLPAEKKYTAVLTTPDGEEYEAEFTVYIVDTKAPVVDGISYEWESGEAYESPVNDTSKKLQITATATDDFSDDISFIWYKNSNKIAEGDTCALNFSDGNGTYYLETADESGNKTAKKEIVINAWDLKCPVIGDMEISPISEWAPFRNVYIEARDNIGIAKKEGYAIAGPFDAPVVDTASLKYNWSSSNTQTITRNGYYYVRVKDGAGNLSDGKEIRFHSACGNGIDSGNPVIEKAEYSIKNEDGCNVIYETIIASDAISGIEAYGYDIDGDGIEESEWGKSNSFRIAYEPGLDSEGRCFAVRDKAGNISTIKVFINSYIPSYSDMQDFVDSIYGISATKTPSDWVSPLSGVTLSFVDDNPSYMMENNYVYDEYRWSDGKEHSYSAKPYFTVKKNGNYKCTLYRNDGGNRGDALGDIQFTVNNIDDVKPALELESDGGSRQIVVKASDEESGVAQIYIKGGEYGDTFSLAEDICEVSDKGQPSVALRTTAIPVEYNGNYRIKIVDAVGNETEKTCRVSGIKFDGAELNIQAVKSVSSNEWASREKGVELSFDLAGIDSRKRENILNVYKWSNLKNYSYDATNTVHENGDYHVILYQKEENGEKGDEIARISFEVSNIDDKAPEIVANQARGDKFITYSVSDDESGIAKLYIKGREYQDWTIIKDMNSIADTNCTGATSLSDCVVVVSSGEYSLKAVDSVGNEQIITIKTTGIDNVEDLEFFEQTVRPGGDSEEKEDENSEGNEDEGETGNSGENENEGESDDFYEDNETEDKNEDADDEDEESDENEGIIKTPRIRITKSVHDYTRGDVTISISIPENVQDQIEGYSWDGGQTWGDDTSYTTNQNGSFIFMIKLKNGGIVASEPIVVDNIDRSAPTVLISILRQYISIDAVDEKSGILKTVVTTPDNENRLLDEGSSDDDGVTAHWEFEGDKLGSYTFVVTDRLGNETIRTVRITDIINGLNENVEESEESKNETDTIVNYVKRRTKANVDAAQYTKREKKRIVWSVEDSSLATIKGKRDKCSIKGLSEGTTRLIATLDGKTIYSKKLEIKPKLIKMKIGRKKKVKIPSAYKEKAGSVQWSTDDAAIAKTLETKTGKSFIVEAIGKGETIVSANEGNKIVCSYTIMVE